MDSDVDHTGSALGVIDKLAGLGVPADVLRPAREWITKQLRSEQDVAPQTAACIRRGREIPLRVWCGRQVESAEWFNSTLEDAAAGGTSMPPCAACVRQAFRAFGFTEAVQNVSPGMAGQWKHGSRCCVEYISAIPVNAPGWFYWVSDATTVGPFASAEEAEAHAHSCGHETARGSGRGSQRMRVWINPRTVDGDDVDDADVGTLVKLVPRNTHEPQVHCGWEAECTGLTHLRLLLKQLGPCNIEVSEYRHGLAVPELHIWLEQQSCER